MVEILPEKQRQFAVDVVRKLRSAGFEAYWAGGCVRDELLGRVPNDYDVATNATPDEIRKLFTRRRTLTIGASFGVITVLGGRDAGQIEVATFRQDATYSDGRRPDSVKFSTAECDASRRDFTINGLFFDPIDNRVIDFVGGQPDIELAVVRAIGDPQKRFEEDKLRMLRAVRFAATLEFALDDETLSTVKQMADKVTVVSVERIATEVRRMLTDPHRVVAVRFLLETGLAAVILPEIVPSGDAGWRRMEHTLSVLDRLRQPSFALALATLLCDWCDGHTAEAICRRWRLSNDDTDRVGWLIAHRGSLDDAKSIRWSILQEILVSDEIDDLLSLESAVSTVDGLSVEHLDYCRECLKQPPDVLDPTPLLTGDDLIAHGKRPGPMFRVVLQRVRHAQLDKEIDTPAEALALADDIMSKEDNE